MQSIGPKEPENKKCMVINFILAMLYYTVFIIGFIKFKQLTNGYGCWVVDDSVSDIPTGATGEENLVDQMDLWSTIGLCIWGALALARTFLLAGYCLTASQPKVAVVINAASLLWILLACFCIFANTVYGILVWG